MKILITGASGYIGSHLSSHLQRKNYYVKMVGRSHQNRIGYERLTNLFDLKTWENLLEDIDVIIHLAASAHIKQKFDTAYYRQNKANPREFYVEVIAPYKGLLECWYYENRCVKLYFTLIILTLFHVVNPKSKAVWRVLKSLPRMPAELAHD